MNREEKRPGITGSAARARARGHFDHFDAERRKKKWEPRRAGRGCSVFFLFLSRRRESAGELNLKSGLNFRAVYAPPARVV
jgi:hypothetical protein